MSRSRRRSAALAFAVTFTLSVAAVGPASATTSVELQDSWFPSVSYSHDSQTISTHIELTTADTSEPFSADDTGWDISLQATSLDYSGPHSGTAISAADLSLISIEAPVPTDGLSEAADPLTGPKIPDLSATGSLATPRVVLQAEPGHARGSYAQELVLSLRLPPGARSGTYTGTVTTTVSPGLPTTPTPLPPAEELTEPTTAPSSSSEPGPPPPPGLTPDPEPTSDTTQDPAPAVESTTEPSPTVAPTHEPSATTEPEQTPPAEPEQIITPAP